MILDEFFKPNSTDTLTERVTFDANGKPIYPNLQNFQGAPAPAPAPAAAAADTADDDAAEPPVGSTPVAPVGGSAQLQNPAARAEYQRVRSTADKFSFSNPEFRKEYDRIARFRDTASNRIMSGNRSYSPEPGLAARQHQELVKMLYQIDADFVQDANILLKNYGALKEQGMDKNNLQGGRPDDEVKFFIDSENAYNHVMDQFGSVIDWDGDTMIAPRKYWGAIQELALAASGEASEEQGMAEGSSYNIDQDDHDEFTPDEIVRIKNSHFPDTLRDNLRAAKKEARRAKHFPSSSDGGDSKLGSPVGSASDNTYEGVAEGSGLNVVKSIKVGNFRHDLVDTGMGWQVRIYNGDELYDTGLSKNSEQKGLAALEDAVAYTEKQTRTKRQGVAEAGYPEVDHMPGPTIKRTQTGCKRCHGKGYVYKTPDGEVHPMNQQGAKKYKCGKCDGIGFVKQDMAEGHGNYAGDRPVNLGGVSMKKIQIGDTVRYIDQTAQVVDMSRDREHARITIPSSATTKTVLTSDLRQLGQGVSEETLSELSPATLARYKIKAGAAATAADSTGDRKTGDRRFSGIVKATKKQFDQDAKQSAQAVHESRLRLMASIIKTK